MARAGGKQGPARRAVVRWAWRLFRREWRQQLLVLALLTVAVAAAVASATVITAMAPDSRGEMGNAKAFALVDGADQAQASSTIDGAKRRFGDAVEVIPRTSVEVPGSAEPLDLRAQDPGQPLGAPMLGLRAGRYPTKSGEVALTRDVADLLSAGVGDRVELGGSERTLVGLVENPAKLDDTFGLVAPDASGPVDDYMVLVPDPHFGAERAGGAAGDTGGAGKGDTGPGLLLNGAQDDSAAIETGLFVVIALAMSLVALIAASAFVVVAQRRQRQLGLLSAIGATGRHLRLVMVANGAIVGGFAALVGSAVGFAVWLVAGPAAESAANHRIERLDLPWGLLVAVVLVGVAMSAAAAWWPARTMARLPVMTALSGRPTPPLPVHRSLLLALVLMAGGVAGIAAARPTDDDPKPLLLMFGVLAVVLGTVFAAPAAVRLLKLPAGRLPFAARLAVRDLVRYQARAAAALAAITLGLGISVVVIAIAAANVYRSSEGNLSDRQLLLRVGTERTSPDPDLSAEQLQRLDDRAATVAQALGDGATTLTLDIAYGTDIPGNPHEPVTVGLTVGPGTVNDAGTPYLATAELLEHFGVDPASIDAETDLLTSQAGNVWLFDIGTRPDIEHPDSPRQHVDLPTYEDAPRSLITEHAMQRHHWTRARAGWFIESPTALTSDQIAAARSAAADVGLAISVRSSQDELAQLRTGATATGALLALAIVAMAVGLIRSESARDIRTLTATGAAPRTRRTLTATTAGALALLGAGLGTAGAYVALVAGYHTDLDKLTPLPAAHLATLVVGVPVAAALAGWLLAGREPRGFARQALE